MKVMICFPPLESSKGFPLLSQNRQFQWFNNPTLIFPIIPASAATLLKKEGFEVAWLDAIAEGKSLKEFFEILEEEKPDLIAIETKTPVVKQHWRIIDEIKKILKSTKIVLMGDHVTALPAESMKECSVDFVITGGDFDFSLLSICEHLSKKTKFSRSNFSQGFFPKRLCKGVWYRKTGRIKNTGKFELSNDLNSLPMIDRELTRAFLYDKEFNIKRKPFAYIMAGRDCPWHKCRFCAWRTLFPKFRVRSVKSVLDEVGMLIEKYKVREVFDDTGTFPAGKWLEEFCKGMIERGYNKKIRFSCNMRVDFLNERNAGLMRKAGFRLLKMGLESANQKTLDRIDKGIKVGQIKNACKIARKAGLEAHLTMMVGYPWETRKEALKTFELAKELMLSDAYVLQSTVVMPYPGTELYQEAVKNNWLVFGAKDYEKLDMSQPVLKTPDMRPEEVMEICGRIYKIFWHPKYILKTLASVRSIEDLKFVSKGAKAVLGHLKDFGRKTA